MQRGRAGRLLVFVSMNAGAWSSAMRVAGARGRCVGGELRSCLYRPFGVWGSGEWEGSLRRRIPRESRRAARRKPAPAGANGWLRVSMCQIASVELAGEVDLGDLGAALAAEAALGALAALGVYTRAVAARRLLRERRVTSCCGPPLPQRFHVTPQLLAPLVVHELRALTTPRRRLQGRALASPVAGAAEADPSACESSAHSTSSPSNGAVLAHMPADRVCCGRPHRSRCVASVDVHRRCARFRQ